MVLSRWTVMPRSASSRLRYWALVLRMLPSSSSVPTLMISAVIVSPHKIHVVGDPDPDALGVLGSLGFQLGQARHPSLGL